MVLYLMEKAGINIVWVFIVGWLSIAAACLYLVLNIPWVWIGANAGVQAWRACFVSATALLVVGYFATKIWPHSEQPAAASTQPSQVPPSIPPSNVPTDGTDAHQQLASGKLAQGWTLHKRGNVFSIYLIMNTDQLNAPMITAIDQADLAPTADQSARISTLWSDIRLRVPQPEPVRTEYGIVEGQEFVEHATHYIQEPNAVTWTYEVMKNGSGITPHPQVFRKISLADLSSDGRKTISELDALAVHTVNRRYIEAMVRISK